MFSNCKLALKSDLKLSELNPTNLVEFSVSEDNDSLKIELINYDTGHEKRQFVILDRNITNDKLIDAVISMIRNNEEET